MQKQQNLHCIISKMVNTQLMHVAKIIQNIIGTHTLSTQSLYINLITASGWLTSISLMNIKCMNTCPINIRYQLGGIIQLPLDSKIKFIIYSLPWSKKMKYKLQRNPSANYTYSAYFYLFSKRLTKVLNCSRKYTFIPNL